MTYHMQVRDGIPNVLYISLSIPGYTEIMANGGQDVLNELYGPLVAPASENREGYDVTLRLNWETLPPDQAERGL